MFGKGADGRQGFKVCEGAVEEGIVGLDKVGTDVGLRGGVGEGTAAEGVDDLFDEGVGEGRFFCLNVIDVVAKALGALALDLVPGLGSSGDAVKPEHDAVGGVAELGNGGKEGVGGDEVEGGVLEQVEGISCRVRT